MAISKALKNRSKPLSTKEKVDLTLKEKNCYACHSRDSIGGPTDDIKKFFHGNESLADEGRFPPNLNAVGAKLTDMSFQKALRGKADTRPYLNVQMPDFGKDVDSIIPLLRKADFQKTEEFPKGDPEIGRKLVGNSGTGCINCHHIGKAKSAGIEGPDLAQIHTKVQQNWFKQNLINPAGFRPGTLMPSFWPNGKSTHAHILNGDTDKQIASIWEYLKNPTKVPDGALKNTGEFQIKVQTKPEYHRSFYKKSIPVLYIGYPNKINLAFNTDNGQIFMSWKGDFIDAYKTWYVRRDPQAELLTNKTSMIDSLFWINSKPVKMKFEGYKRTPNGTVLLYSGEDFKVKEIIKTQGNHLQRDIHVSTESKSQVYIKTNGATKPLTSGIYKEIIK